MKILITGGAGFIGSHLAEKLLKQGNTVYVIDDLSTGNLKNIEHLIAARNFKIAVETILNETVMDRLVSKCDTIYHLAASVGVELIIKKPIEVIKTNILGTQLVLKLANRYLKKVMLASSSEIYGKNTKMPLKENDDRVLGPTTKKRWSYSCSKAVNEFLSLAYHEERNLNITIVRLFNIIGPRQTGRYGMVVPRFINQALRGEDITVYGTGEQIRCFSYITDVIDAMIYLAHHSQVNGQVFNIGNKEPISILDLAKKIKEITQSHSEIKLIPYEQAYEEGFEDMELRIPDISKIKDYIGYEPKVSLDEGLKKLIAYYQNQMQEYSTRICEN